MSIKIKGNICTLFILLIGIFASLFMAWLAPLNDQLFRQSPVFGSAIPTVPIFIIFIAAIVMNTGRRKSEPAKALRLGYAIMLASAGVAGFGATYYLPGVLVGTTHQLLNDQSYEPLAKQIGNPVPVLPAGPNFETTDADRRFLEGFLARDGEQAQILPPMFRLSLMFWGAIIVSTWLVTIGAISLISGNWIVDQALPYPTVAIVNRLIGHSPFNNRPIFRSRLFWWAFALVTLLRLTNSLAILNDRIPSISLSFSLESLATAPPWSFTAWYFRNASIIPVVVAITYFTRQDVACSIWFFSLLEQFYLITVGCWGGEAVRLGAWDQHFGAMFVLTTAILWRARRRSFKRRCVKEVDARSIPVTPGIVLLLAGVVLLLLLASVGDIPLFVMISTLTMNCMSTICCCYIVASTGIPSVYLLAHVAKPIQILSAVFNVQLLNSKSTVFSGILNCLCYDTRERLAVYYTQILRFVRSDSDTTRLLPRSMLGYYLGGVVLAVICLYIGLSHSINIELQNEITLDPQRVAPMNNWTCQILPRWMVLDPAAASISNAPTASRSSTHFLIGVAITVILFTLHDRGRIGFLHPIGYLLLPTGTTQIFWFSVLCGYLIKRVTLWLGGASVFESGKDVMVGVVTAELTFGGLWILASLVSDSLSGSPLPPISILPG